LEIPNKADSENDVILNMHNVGNYKEFLCINSSLQCYNESEDCEEAIVEHTVAKHQETSEDQEAEEDGTIEHEQVTNQDARKFIDGL
jgi:hypothetical protein